MKVLFTGGGTAGHVTPNIALMEAARQKGWELLYLGSPDGIEGGIIGPLGVPFHAVQSGKLRRYFSWKNLLDPLRVLVGLLQSLVICLREKPDRVLLQGWFCLGAGGCRRMAVSHPGCRPRIGRYHRGSPPGLPIPFVGASASPLLKPGGICRQARPGLPALLCVARSGPAWRRGASAFWDLTGRNLCCSCSEVASVRAASIGRSPVPSRPCWKPSMWLIWWGRGILTLR